MSLQSFGHYFKYNTINTKLRSDFDKYDTFLFYQSASLRRSTRKPKQRSAKGEYGMSQQRTSQVNNK